MPERKSRKAGNSRKGKKRTDVETHAEILPVKDLWERTFDSMPDLIAILDTEHRIKRANRAMAQRLGTTPGQCVGLNCFKCVHKLDAPPSFCPHSLTMADGKEHIAEIHEDNLGGDFLASTTPLFDQQGKIIGSVHVARDITQRKKAEEEIKSLSRFPAENPNVVMRISKDGNMLYSNDAGLPILNEWRCQVGQSVPSKWRQFVADVFKSGMKKEFEEEHDAQTFLIMLAPIVDEGYVNVYGRDITERKKAEKALLESEERFRAIAETSPIQISVSRSSDGVILFTNPAYDQTFGFAKGELIGVQAPNLYMDPADRKTLIEALMKQGFVRDHEIRVKRKDGTPFWVAASVASIRFGGEQARLDVSVDITERKKAEEALRKAHEELETRVQERTKELREASEGLQAEITERKRAEDAVKTERKRFIDVLEKLPAYLVLLTPDYHVSYANRFFRERFGEDRGRRCFEYLFSRTEPCETCETYKTLKSMAPLEWEWTGPDGHNYYIFDSPFTDIDGSTLIMEVGIDITERKKAEEALRKAHEELETRVEERTRELRQSAEVLQAEVTERKKAEEELRETRNYLENLIDYANAPIIVWNPDYRITRFNRAFERLTGLKAEEVLGKPLEILFPENSKEKSMKHIHQTTSGAYWETVEIPILRTDGLVRTVLWNSANILGKDGATVVATIAQGQDITESKKAQQALIESQIDLNRAQAVAKTGSWRLGVRRNELLWSDETHRMFGIPNGTPLMYETFLNAVHPDDREYVDQKWQAAMRGEPYDIEHRIVVDGEVKWVREKAKLELDKDGLLLGGFGTVQEITEFKEMQAKLEDYSKHLEQLVEEKTQKLKEAERLVTIGETASMVGHDIRNPLQSIEGAVYLAEEELGSLPADRPEKKELHEILEIIRHQTDYIDRIVADLQDYSRTPMVQFKETNLQDLITDALAMTEIPENIHVQTLIQGELQTVQVDSVCLKRVLLNLIENAVHAMPNGGELTIKAFKQDECTHIHVEDTGICIPKESKPKIFTPLFTTKAKGQGFGLAVCKKLVEAHNGEITFESEAGKGTTFKVKLPQRKEAV